MTSKAPPLKHLENLKRIIDMTCEDIKACATFQEHPEEKLQVVTRALTDLVFKLDYNNTAESCTMVDLEKRTEEILEFINSRYQYYLSGGDKGIRNKPIFTIDCQKDYIPWRLHDTHFHPAFDDYIKCPYTCMAELSELFEKILKNMEST